MTDNVETEAPEILENENYEEELENESYENDHTDFSVVVIKQEVLNYYDSEFESTTISVQDRKPNSEITYSEDYQKHLLNCNKIILGSKPNIATDESDGEVDVENIDEVYLEYDECFTDDTKRNVNCIDENDFEEFVSVYKPKVDLPDAHSYLDKSKRFCDTCGILFPDCNIFKNHLQTFHAVKVQKKIDISERRIYKCTICYSKFVTRQVLRRHLEKIHFLNIEIISQILTKAKYKRRPNKEMRQHRCTICTKSFVAAHVLRRHLENIHKFNSTKVSQQQEYQSNIKNTTKVFDSQNVNYGISLVYTCYHCKKTFDTQKSLNKHLDDILQMKRKNTETIPVLKSILFKCNKCDIHFTSSQFAADHAQHMEMLINWKCTICNRIFKKEDSSSHEMQHSVANNFLVYNLENLDISKILYKCSKCSMHFTENNFLYHFRDCGLQITKFVKCHICDISLDYNLKALHESDKHTEPNHYTVIESDVISENPVKSTAKQIYEEEKLVAQLNPFREVKVVLQKIDSHNHKNLEKNKQENENKYLRPMKYYYCKTCKCFITDFMKKIHLHARCKNFPKVSCKHCGLMFTKVYIMTHMRLHEEMKDLTWYNFKFFYLDNGQPMNPAIIEVANTKGPASIKKRFKKRQTYHYCENCKCVLPTLFKRKARQHKQKICLNWAKITCTHCGLKFISGGSAMKTHELLHDEMKDLTLDKFKILNVRNGQPMNLPTPEVTSINQPFTNAVKNWHNRQKFIYYYCETCKCFLSIFRKRAHLEGRCKNFEKTTCEDCGLTLTKASMLRHKRLHEQNKNMSINDFKFFNLYSGRPMNSPLSEIANIKERVDIEVKEPENNEANVVNMDQPRHSKDEILDTKRSLNSDQDCCKRLNFTYYFCEACKCYITKFKQKPHLEARCKNLKKMHCRCCGLTFTTASMRTHLRLHKKKRDLSIKNFKFFDLYSGQPMSPPTVKFVNTNQPTNNDEDVKKNKKSLNIDHWHTRRNLSYYYCDTCQCFVTKFNKNVHLEARCKKLGKSTCHDCGLMLTKTSMVTHKLLHEHKKDLTVNNFKFFNLSDGLPMSPPLSDVLSVKQPANNELLHVHKTWKKKDGRKSLNMIYYFCETCKCCVTHLKKVIHLDARCKNFAKMICIRCGLMFTTASIMTHRNLHKKNTNLSLKNFTFFNLNNGQPIKPPVTGVVNVEQSIDNEVDSENVKRSGNIEHWHTRPNLTYFYCETCKCFITNFKKGLHLEERCKLLAKTSCEHCGLTFTSASLLTHKRLHQENKDLSLQSFKILNLYNGQPVNLSELEILNPKRPVNHKTELKYMKNSVNIQADEQIKELVINDAKTVRSKIPGKVEVENIKETFKRETKFENLKLLTKTNVEVEDVIRIVNSESDFPTKKQFENDLVNGNLCEYESDHVENESEDVSINPSVNNGSDIEFKNVSAQIKAKDIVSVRQLVSSNGEVPVIKLPETGHLHKETEVESVELPMNVVSEVGSSKLPEKNENEHAQLKERSKKLTYSYYYCETCKCFVAKRRKNLHLQARCKNFPKTTCKCCDLMFTKKSIDTHRRLHKENCNFNFFNLYNGKRIWPHTSEIVNKAVVLDKEVVANKKVYSTNKNVVNSDPLMEEQHMTYLSYYYCESCKSFLKCKDPVHLGASCKDLIKLPCKHCGLVLNSTSATLHKSLHEERRDLTLKDFKFFNLHSGLPISPPIPEYPKCVNCAVHFLTVTAKNCHVCSEVASLTCHVCEIELSEAAFKLHMTFHQYPTDGTKTIEANDLEYAKSLDPNSNKEVSDENVPNSTNLASKETDILSSLDVTKTPLQTYELIYSCRNCSVSVDTYDKAVEHCQRHYENEELVTRTIVCNDCNFNLDEACYTEHQNNHKIGCKFKSLHFDSYYLPAENNKWIYHIFKTLPKEKVSDILRKSIYRYECRMKMDVIQQGDPALTVYRCDQCSCFIEPCSLFKHSDNACFKLRNHPCTVCDIPFNSSASRVDHEKIHSRPGVTADSYRIVVFNRKQDLQVNRSFCLRKNYVLYKCRNCGVIIDKLLGDFHECDFTNVKECPDCALLLSIKDYESHMSTHKEFISFNYKNMKVILLGEASPIESLGKNNLKSNFKGAIYDYKIFVCNKCQLCIKNEKDMSKHICRFGKQRLKCLKCSLYFSVGRLKTHMRCHEQDPDFIRSNMYIINFDSSTLDQNKNATKVHSKDKEKNCELSDSNTDSDSEILSANDISMGDDADMMNDVGEMTKTVVEETVKIYRCTCELHFLNEDSLSRHFGTCRSNTKVAKLKCQKCDLLFTPNVLFTHLLAHHSNKSRRYKYDIVEINRNQDNVT